LIDSIYYDNTSGFGANTTPAAMVTAIAAAFGGISGGGGESGSIFSGVNKAIGGFGLGANAGDGAPAAFLNYILFDQDYKVMDMGWTRVPSTAATKVQVTIPTINVKEMGYLFTYLSFEDQSNNYVEFDDFKITLTPSNVIQYNEYYPFGLQTKKSWTRGTASNNYLYNQGSELNGTTGLYDLPLRNYDASLGRFFQIDPMAAQTHDQTTYGYANNNPVVMNDPMGDFPKPHIEVNYCPTYENTFNLPSMAPTDWDLDWGFNASAGGGFVACAGGGDFSAFWDQVFDAARKAPSGTEVLGRDDEGTLGIFTTTVTLSGETNALASGYDQLGAGLIFSQKFVPVQASQGYSPGSDTWDKTSNYMTGIGMAIDGAAYRLGASIDKRLAYNFTKAFHEGPGVKIPPINFKGFNIPTGFAKGAANTLKVGGAALGIVGLGMTGYEIYTGEKSLVGEGGLDLIMGGVAFIPGGGWIVSGAYFGGKFLLEQSGNDFWNNP
jgi:RHS repeat-associated protein